MRSDAERIIKGILDENMPYDAVVRALEGREFLGEIYAVSIGKAGWTMAKAASEFLGGRIKSGIVITKYEHSQGEIENFKIFEAAHPIIDENSLKASRAVLDLVSGLDENAVVLFLLSGGGSSLFEALPEGITLDGLVGLSEQLLKCGADIVEINTVRKRLSLVKAGRFAQICKPARVFSIVLSDVLGNRLDSIASGPTAADESTSEQALSIIKKYNIKLDPIQEKYLSIETPKIVDNVENVIIGSVDSLCTSAARICENLGYTPHILTTMLNCQAVDAGKFLSSIAIDIKNGKSSFKPPCAIIAGGESVVYVVGDGVGGRNQELTLSAAKGIKNLDNVLLFSLGSDGTDGPTDAAGGIIDGNTAKIIQNAGKNIDALLANNDSYNGLNIANALIKTGPTGTNLNDIVVLLVGCGH